MRAFGRRLRFLLPLLAVAVIFVGLAVVVEARPGGGQGYSGGRGGGGGGGGGGSDSGGGEVIELLIWLCIRHPKIGIPLLIVFAIWTWQRKRGLGAESYESSAPPPPRRALLRRDISEIARVDPDFSAVLFEDFAYRLFAAAHHASGDARRLAAFAPYLQAQARGVLSALNPVSEPVAGVIVGSMACVGLSMPDGPALDQEGARILLTLDFEANLTMGRRETERGVFVHERWSLSRSAAARSRPPGASAALGCPSCGAPFRSTDHETCESCGETVGNGRFDWTVTAITRQHAALRPPALVSHVAEQGTDRPTVLHPQRSTEWADLVAGDPAVTEESLAARAALIFDELNRAWAKRDLQPVRPFVSDGLISYLSYWTSAYRRAGLTNHVADARVTARALARVQRDKWYDSVTLRLWAEGKDFTLRDADASIVGGSKSSTRRWSEYWTLIRRREAKGRTRLDASCPRCGAPLENIAMSGECAHCGSHVTGGEFDWVLSRIEQDEAYLG